MESIVCPVIFSLIKQLDRLVTETTARCDSYIIQLTEICGHLVSLVPDHLPCKLSIVKKKKLVVANAFLKVHDLEQASENIQ